MSQDSEQYYEIVYRIEPTMPQSGAGEDELYDDIEIADLRKNPPSLYTG